MSETIQLWTWHPKGFAIDRDTADDAQSQFLQNCPELKAKYQCVRERYGSVLWCQTKWSEWSRTEPRECWELRVPACGVCAFVDEELAYRICHHQPIPGSQQEWLRIRRSAEAAHPTNRNRCLELMAAEIQKVTTTSSSTADLSCIFVPQDESWFVSALVRSPVPSEWKRPRDA